MLSQGHMGAPLYRYTSQADPRFGDSWSLEEWKWCHYVMVEAYPPQTTSYIHIWHIQRVWAIVMLSQGHMGAPIPLHQPSWPQIWEVRVTWGVEMIPQRHGWGWCPPQTASYIHIRHEQSVWAIGMLSQGNMGAPLYHYTGQVGPRFVKSGSLVEW